MHVAVWNGGESEWFSLSLAIFVRHRLFIVSILNARFVELAPAIQSEMGDACHSHLTACFELTMDNSGLISVNTQAHHRVTHSNHSKAVSVFSFVRFSFQITCDY